MGNERVEPRATALSKALRSPFADEQRALREPLRQSGDYMAALRTLAYHNPFFRLTDPEVEALTRDAAAEPLAGLIAARHQAVSATAPRYVVFCMPKSGSSFLKSALAHALELPVVSLTTFGNTKLSSMFGMNGREQEIDEMALVKAALSAPGGFVAQHHTRYTPYLGHQLQTYGLRPIVTQRNVLDALVSFDDMMMTGRAPHDRNAWIVDSQFALPAGYGGLAPDARFRIIGASLGVWLIQFHLSWLRAARQRFVEPLFIRYRTDILDPARLTARLAEALDLDDAQRDRLADFAAHPDPAQSRLNVGRAGRGREQVPADVRESLRAYAEAFAEEIPADDLVWLLT